MRAFGSADDLHATLSWNQGFREADTDDRFFAPFPFHLGLSSSLPNHRILYPTLTARLPPFYLFRKTLLLTVRENSQLSFHVSPSPACGVLRHVVRLHHFSSLCYPCISLAFCTPAFWRAFDAIGCAFLPTITGLFDRAGLPVLFFFYTA